MSSRLEYQLSKADLVLPEKVIKRDGGHVEFDLKRIERAVESCYAELQHMGNIPSTPVKVISENCAVAIASRYGAGEVVPSVEMIQDLVEVTLLTHREVDAARAYMAYRDTHTKMRGGTEIPDHVREAFEVDAQYFPTPMQRFAFYDKYSRFNLEMNRRETWPETVDRTIDHLKWEVFHHTAQQNAAQSNGAEFIGYKGIDALDLSTDQYAEFVEMPVEDEIWDRLRAAILAMKIMPSMRLLAMAGPAARRNSIALYNCSYLPISDIEAFVEILVISMSGCGVGYSVERSNVEQFPRVKRQLPNQKIPTHVVEDTSEGWAETLRKGLKSWWNGLDIHFDTSLVRPAGSVLRTKGGRASGPAPLVEMLRAIREIILSRQGSFIGTVQAHDIACNTGEAAVQGGVRRTAMIALFDFFDDAMRNCKNGPWGTWPKIRTNANNSAVWPENISDLDIMKQMMEMVTGCSGEPGIFSRAAGYKTMPTRRQAFGMQEFGINPCGEILLRPYEFCNLSQAISRSGDTEEELAEKCELAAILGTIQSLSTRFPGLRDEWAENCAEERLLGVDLTAQNDCELLWPGNPEGDTLRQRLKAHVVSTNEKWARTFGIKASSSTTCNKPAGNSTGFIGASGSGIHKAPFPFGVRRMTVGAHTPQFRVLREHKVPMQPYAGYTQETADRWWAEFPQKSPAGAPLLRDTSAIEQCEFWLLNKMNWTEHNPSCTIQYRIYEVVDLVKWICEHKDVIGGLSFLPVDDATYPIMPFEETSEAEYNERVAKFPEVDYSYLYLYERTDMTTASTTLACFAGSCEI